MQFSTRQILQLVREAISDGDMDRIWKVIQSELDADFTIEYENGPVQLRFGDFLSGSFKRISIKKMISETISMIDGDEDSYQLEIADTLIKEGNRLRKAVELNRKKSVLPPSESSERRILMKGIE